MARSWPMFEVYARRGNCARWIGSLRPLFQTFYLQVDYRAPAAVEQLSARTLQPRVRILSPALRHRPGDPEGRLPHVYFADGDVWDPYLCMFDPDANEWSPCESLADTTLPWAIEWLASYEGWRATGQWTASGKHVSPDLQAASR